MIKAAVQGVLRRCWGVELRPIEAPRQRDDKFLQIFSRYEDATMVAASAGFVFYNSINYVIANNVPGAVIECGVYRGGLCGMAAELLNGTGRKVYLFDTFSGMPRPSASDFRLVDKLPASEKFHNGWCEGSLQTVRETMARSGCPEDQIQYVVGKVEDTLQDFKSPAIAVLRLDTDFYESTKAELDYLFDYVSPGGVIIIDDYSVWSGARKAVDEFLESRNLSPLLHFEPSVGGISFIKT